MNTAETITWYHVAMTSDFPYDGGSCVKLNDTQVAIFNFASKGKWYAVQNMCPHKKDNVLSRGFIGDQKGEPKVACPQHKKTFSLESGTCLGGENYNLQTYPVKIEGSKVYLGLG